MKNPFTKAEPAPQPSLAELRKKLDIAIVERQRYAAELAVARTRLTDIALDGTDPAAAAGENMKIHSLTDAIALSDSVIARREAMIAPLAAAERAEQQRAADEARARHEAEVRSRIAALQQQILAAMRRAPAETRGLIAELGKLRGQLGLRPDENLPTLPHGSAPAHYIALGQLLEIDVRVDLGDKAVAAERRGETDLKAMEAARRARIEPEQIAAASAKPAVPVVREYPPRVAMVPSVIPDSLLDPAFR